MRGAKDVLKDRLLLLMRRGDVAVADVLNASRRREWRCDDDDDPQPKPRGARAVRTREAWS